MLGNLAQDAVNAALDAARSRGTTYADVRVATIRNQQVLAEDRRIERITDAESCGIGVRVIADGAWGFAATNEVSPAEAEAAARAAIEVARAGASLRKGPPVVLADEPPHRDRYSSPRETDPFDVPIERKTALLLAAHDEILKVAGVRKAHSFLRFKRETKTFANSEGSLIETDILSSTCGLRATAVASGDAQTRKYEPPALNRGFEIVAEANLISHAPRVAAEAVEKLRARPSPTERMDLILLPSHLWLTIHESVGHATELDRVIGMEESLSGGSFAALDRLGQLRYGSPLINFRALNARPGLLASTGYDDDGVECQDWDVVRDGILVGYTTTREVARAMGEGRSRGSSRADSWAAIPILRMPNLCLMPGRERLSLDEIIADTRHAILIDGDGSFSIDQKRLNFQFGGDAFWEIRDGKRVGMLRDVTYFGITPEFWNSCDALCDEREWRSYGAQNCGKGDPMQIAQMTTGTAPARFRSVEVRRAQ
jgi:TldD protein